MSLTLDIIFVTRVVSHMAAFSFIPMWPLLRDLPLRNYSRTHCLGQLGIMLIFSYFDVSFLNSCICHLCGSHMWNKTEI